MSLTVCVAQLNYVVGDIAGNAQKIIQTARAAYARGVRLVLTPELALCGYAAEDWLLRPSFIAACDQAVTQVAQALADLPDLILVLGSPSAAPVQGGIEKSVVLPPCQNTAHVLRQGQRIALCVKRELPNYQVFDERRYFASGPGFCVFTAGSGVDAIEIGLLICEDAWYEEPARCAQQAGAQLLVSVNASPFHLGKGHERERMMGQRTRAVGLPLIYAHLVGGQDEVVFDGGSFALQADGQLAGRAPSFQENNFEVRLNKGSSAIKLEAQTTQGHSDEASLWHALVLAVRDYVGKNGFASVVLGLSGGIDSALVLCLAVDALGPRQVHAVMMPSRYTADMSLKDAHQIAQNLGVRYDEIAIEAMQEAYRHALQPLFAAYAEDLTEENLQARIRGTLLMALSNKFGALVLTTGNKSELATGYCTLYGDMAGGFAPIKDVFKTMVYQLARWRNEHDPYTQGAHPIPERIIERAPSAELRANQTDQDSLPPYEVLDEVLRRYVEEDASTQDLVAAGFDLALAERVVQLVERSEYKRGQAPLGPRVSHRSFGKDWRYPVTTGGALTPR